MFAFVFAALLSCQQQVPNSNSDPRVWNEPSIERSSFTSRNGGWEFDIQKVLFGDTETTVYMRVHGYRGDSYTFAAGTTLKADGKTYKLNSIDGLTPGQYKPIDNTNIDDIVFHFEPMPLGTKSFDLLESDNIPRAFNIYGIHMTDLNSPVLRNTHWRNLRTGDWTVSFMDDCVIYDCKVWKYETALTDSTPSAQTITITSDAGKANVQIGPLKKGRRTIRIQAPNGTKQFSCAPFDSKTLPEYPRIERRAFRLVDYGYESIDSVTVSGILIGPGRDNNTFSIDVIDPIAGENPAFTFDTDPNGFFTVRFPLANSSNSVVRSRSRAAGFVLPLEPGQTYFVFNDVNSGRQFIMGQKSRVQNEFIKHSDEFYVNYDRIEESKFQSDQNAYLDYLVEQRNRHFARLDSLQKAHPSISDAYLDMSRAYATVTLYNSIGQARFHNEEEHLAIPASLVKFIKDDIKAYSIKPYSLYYEFNYFLRDFIQSLYQPGSREVSISLTDIINMAIQEKAVRLTPEQTELARWYGEFHDMISNLARECVNDQKRFNDTIQAIITPDVQSKLEKVDLLGNETGLMDYVNKNAERISFDHEFKHVVNALDTMGFEKRLNEIMITHYMTSQIQMSRHSAPAAILARFDSIVSYKPCQDAVHALNDKYLALENVDLASLGNTVSDEEIAAMSDGQLILRKITEPYRGKIVYIDIWGSWCHPCLENLQHAGELKEALKEFDIIYLYLASSTTDSAWKGVIKEYNLTGDNCVHYNLPAKQQTLVENYLKVTGYPSYYLLNRNGALLDVSCHPSNLAALIETLKKL